jgi:hypothetical protein
MGKREETLENASSISQAARHSANFLTKNKLKYFLIRPQNLFLSRDSSVGIALRYGVDDRGSRVRTVLGPAHSPI